MRNLGFKACPLALLVLLLPVRSADLASHAFTYQGRLFQGTNAANGIYDLRFMLYDAGESGSAVASEVTTNALAISNGMFTVGLDFGPVFDGSPRWLEIAERTNGVGTFTTLVPRQFLATVPYASYAAKAGVAGSIPASGLTGLVPDDRLSTNVALVSQSAVFNGLVTATGFRGNAAGLSNVVVPDGSISMAKLGADAQFVRAPYASVISSGMGKTYALRVLIDGVLTDPPAKLAGEYAERRVPIAYQDGEERLVRYRPGIQTNSSIVLHRKVGSSRTWLQYLRDVADGKSSLPRHKLELVLTSPRGQVVSWEFTNCLPSMHSYRLAEDGMPLEELTLGFVGPVTRKATDSGASVPIGSGVQTGFSSGQPRPIPYQVWVEGTSWSGTCLVGSDVANKFEMVQYKTAEGVMLLRPGGSVLCPFTLRQGVLAANDLFDWYRACATGAVIRRTVEFRLGTMPLEQCLGAYPFSYRLVIGDDGLPFEEYQVVYEGFVVVP